jgi:hypothetical protein
MSANGTETILKTFNGALTEDDVVPLSVVLFQGDDIISKSILDVESVVDDKNSILKYGVWSHCGVLVTSELLPNIPELKDIPIAIMEMTCTGRIAGDMTPDLQTDRGRFGLQLRDFSKVLKTYKGKVAICKLTENPFFKKSEESDEEFAKRKQDLIANVELFYKQHRNTMYQLNFLRLLASAFPFMRWLRRFLPLGANWKMCSDIVATFYKQIGVFGNNLTTEDCIPQDFIKDSDKEIPDKTFIMPPIQIITV